MPKLKLLFLQADYSAPTQAKHWAYWNHFGLARVLMRHDFDVSLCRIVDWHKLGSKFLAAVGYDLCVVNDLAHGVGERTGKLSRSDLLAIKGNGCKIVGLTAESLYSYRSKQNGMPSFVKERLLSIEPLLELFDGFLLADIQDGVETGFSSKPFLELTPFICDDVLPVSQTTQERSDQYIFLGALNEKRTDFLKDFKKIDNFRLASLHNEDLKYWNPYEQLSKKILSSEFDTLEDYKDAINGLVELRRSAYAAYISAIRRFQGLVHLPTFFGGLHPRFVEAGISGLLTVMPVLSRKEISLVELVPNIHYVPFDPQNSGSLIDALEYLRRNESFRLSVGRNARLLVNECFSEPAQGFRLSVFLRDLLNVNIGDDEWDTGVNVVACSEVVSDAAVFSTKSISYFLPKYYMSRLEPEYYEDVLSDTGVVWQPDVYALAGQIATSLNASSLIDLGCGTGEKLVETGQKFGLVTIGIDYGLNIQGCKTRFPGSIWIDRDLEQDEIFSSVDMRGSVVIHSDVIEHLRDPAFVLNSLRGYANDVAAILISTPDRDLVRGSQDCGPPRNRAHVREWGLTEFASLLESFSLSPVFVGYTRENTVSNRWTTILAVISQHRLPLFDERSVGLMLRGKSDQFYLSKL